MSDALLADLDWILSQDDPRKHVSVSFLESCRAALAERDAEREKYQELLYAVASKFPGESRHQTALRYILNMEHGGTDGQRAAGYTRAEVPFSGTESTGHGDA